MMNEYSDKELNESTKSLKDYFYLIRNNLTPVIIIVLICLSVSIVYAVRSEDIYKSTTSLKISKPKGNILEGSIMPDDFTSDRFLSTEMEIMKSRSVRLNVARALLDSIKKTGVIDDLFRVQDQYFDTEQNGGRILTAPEIAEILAGMMDIEQKRGLDIVEISVESLSSLGSAIIANVYANEYKLFNLEVNRNQLSNVRDFLLAQVKDKQLELKDAEINLTSFQAEKGIISLDAQSQSLITQLAGLEAQRDGAKIELSSTEKILDQLKNELSKQDPKITAYIENLASQSYFQTLQDQIAKLQVNRDLVLTTKNGNDNSAVIKQYDDQILDLKKKLAEKTKTIKEGLFASNPASINDITTKILDSEVKIKGLISQLTQLNIIISKYDSQFNKLPQTSISYAQLQRKREASEKLFSLLEEKYQEALINEQSEPGNVFIIDEAVKPDFPSKPNRLLIMLAGLFGGIILSFGFVYIQDYFDQAVHTPEDIQKRNINLLAWVPQIETGGSQKDKIEFIIAEKPKAVASEAFKALRTRIQFSKIGEDALKTVLVTSAAPSEGKTTISVNLAGVFAQTGKKTLILDSDLRKPRIHNIFKHTRVPGFIDYFFDKASFDEITRTTPLENLSFISTGTIPPNPSEILDSVQMKEFLNKLKSIYDIIIIDSAPLIAVTDTEILSRMVDATVLVVSADATEIEMMEKGVDLLKYEGSSFIGAVLNKFSYKAGYGSYYKYYYYYSGSENGKDQESTRVQA